MTLIEVVASLALLGSLLGAAVVAKGKLTRQWTASQHRAEALAALEDQFRGWASADDGRRDLSGTDGSAWPTSGEGPLGDGRWWWRAETREVTNDTIAEPAPELAVIRYTVFARGGPRHSPPGSSAINAAPVTIDVFAPYEPPTEPNESAAPPESTTSGGAG